MLNNYEEFLMNSLVIEVESIADVYTLCRMFKKMGLSKVDDFFRASKGDFYGLLYNYPLGELCIEYQLGKGFTISDKTGNIAYGNAVVKSGDFINEIKDTQNSPYIKKDYLKIFDEVSKLPSKIDVIVEVYRLRDGVKEFRGYVKHNMRNWFVSTPSVFKTKSALENTLNVLYNYGNMDEYVYEIKDAN